MHVWNLAESLALHKTLTGTNTFPASHVSYYMSRNAAYVEWRPRSRLTEIVLPLSKYVEKQPDQTDNPWNIQVWIPTLYLGTLLHA